MACNHGLASGVDSGGALPRPNLAAVYFDRDNGPAAFGITRAAENGLVYVLATNLIHRTRQARGGLHTCLL